MSYELVSVHKIDYFVIPAAAGPEGPLARREAEIQNRLKLLDSRFHACALKRYGAQARE